MIRDIRYALRALCNSPGFTLAAVLAFALGIGANTAVFTLIDAVLLRPLPFRDPGRLVMAWEDASFLGFPKDTPAPANFVDWKRRNHVFEDMAALRSETLNLTGSGAPEEVQAKAVTANFFPLMGIRPLRGRTFSTEEDRAGGPRMALISEGLWTRRFGADPKVEGQSILLNGIRHRILGVLPSGFDYPDPVDVWIPMDFSAEQLQLRGSHYLQVVARLRGGVSLQQARLEMTLIAKDLEREYPATNTKLGITLAPVREEIAGSARLAVIMLWGAVGGVLLIACANVANLQLTRASSRRQEFAIRSALGANASRLARQALIESGIAATLGGGCGLLAAAGSFAYLRRLLPPSLGANATLHLDGAALGATMAVTLAAALLSGLGPAWKVAGHGGAATLRATGRSLLGGGASKLRSALVVLEICLASILLCGSGLLIEALARLSAVNLGFQTEHVLCARTALPMTRGSKYLDLTRRAAFYKRVLTRVSALPGVTSAAYVTFLPLTYSGGTLEVAIEGRPDPPAGQVLDANFRVITPDYLRTLGIPVLSGRPLSETDTLNAPPVALINSAMARRYWPGENPLGQRFTFDGREWVTVVGIVGDTRQSRLDVPPRPEMYVSYQQKTAALSFFAPRDLVVRTSSGIGVWAAAVRRAVAEADPDQPVSQLRTMGDLITSELTPREIQMKVLIIFSGIALMLATLGVYSVGAYAITQRIPEFGLRLALGEPPAHLQWSTVARGLRLALVGIVMALPCEWVLARLLGTLLFETPPFNPVVFAITGVILAAAAAAASYLPGRRAARLDPWAALRLAR
jgi:predicted permease